MRVLGEIIASDVSLLVKRFFLKTGSNQIHDMRRCAWIPFRRGRCESDRGAPIGSTIAKESAADVLFPSELEEQTDKHSSTAIDRFRSGGV